jgi:spermidine/putrescine transport system permease protein
MAADFLPGGKSRVRDPSRRGAFGLRLAAGPTLWLVAFLIGPLGILVVWSFQPPGTVLGSGGEFSTSAYSSILGVESYRELLLWTVLASAIVAGLSVLFAFPIAYLLALVAGRRRYILLGIAFVPFLTSYVLRIFAWRLILGQNGLLNEAAMSWGFIDEPLSALLYSRLTVIIVLTYVWVPWAALPIFVRLDALDRSLLEAAADLGVSPLRTVRRVVLPLALPGLYTAFFLVFIPTLGDFATAAAVGGADGIMLGNVVQRFLSTFDLPSGAVLTVILLTVAALLMLLAVRLIRIRAVTDVQL